MPALFLALFSNSISALSKLNLNLTDSTEDTIASHPTWSVLLHLHQHSSQGWHRKEPQISDEHFLLSKTRFSPVNELRETLALYRRAPEEALCRFPARLAFIEQFVALNLASVKQCDSLQEYLDKVPFDQVELIFASEVLASSTSMMGHSFVKVSGLNKNNRQASHSLSFFSEITTFNPFSLINDALISGMPGFFMVRPFEQDKVRYLNNEKRNLWSYQLNLSDTTKQLIRRHIWELKDIDITYYFQSYNCATLTLDILAIADSSLLDHKSLFVSPLDVVKAVNASQLVSRQQVILSSEWEQAMLVSALSSEVILALESAIQTPSSMAQLEAILANLSASQKTLALQYLHRSNKEISGNQNIAKWVEQQFEANKGLALDLSQYKNPARTLQDSAMSLLHVNNDDFTAIDWHFLPASHYLRRNNRQYFSESELSMGEIGIRWHQEDHSADLRLITLYSMRNLLPSNLTDSRYSSQFYLGYRHRTERAIDDQGSAELSIGMGKSYRLHQDVLVYGMINVGFTTQLDNLHPLAESQLGLVTNLVASSKLLVEHTSTFAQFGSYQTIHQNRATLSIGLSDQLAFNLIYRDAKMPTGKQKELAVGVDFLF